jgi:surface antigen
MNWNISYDPDNKYVLVSIAGAVNREDLIRVSEEAIRGAMKQSTRQFLFDLRTLTGSEVSLDDAIQSIPEILHMMGLSHRSKIALITYQHIPYPDQGKLWVKQQREHGYEVQVFPSPKYANEWLRLSPKQISF